MTKNKDEYSIYFQLHKKLYSIILIHFLELYTTVNGFSHANNAAKPLNEVQPCQLIF